MTEMDDHELLAEFVRSDSETAFAGLVGRHVNLVFSAALRFSGNVHSAEEITQAVFIILARKAGRLSPHVVLSGWLYETARLTAANFVKGEVRRREREQEAHMQSTLNETDRAMWEQLGPLLDEAMGQLGETDRNAVVLRFFENKTAQEVGAALRLNEAAAHKRVSRAVEKLRRFFAKRGVVLSAAAIAGAVSANSVQAAPAGLTAAVTAAAAKGAVVGGSTLTLIHGALKVMAWAQAKTAIVVVAAAILAAGTTAVVVTRLDQGPALFFLGKLSPEDAYLTGEFLGDFDHAPPALFVRATHFPGKRELWAWKTGDIACAAGRNVPFAGLLDVAYHFKHARMVLPSDIPRTNFDFLATLPNCPNEKFQETVKNTLGWTAHTEMRETGVLLLKAKIAAAPGLIPGVATNHGSRLIYGGNVYHATSMPISDLREFLEDEIFHQPVLDRTGLTNKYEIILDWQAASPTQSYEQSDSLKKVLLDRLGLELVPARERIEMLVVGRARD